MFLEPFLSTFPFNVLNAGSFFFSHPSWVRISPVAKRHCPVTFHSWQPRGDVASTEASPLYLSVWLIVFCVYFSRSGLDLLLGAMPCDTPFKFLLKLELDLCVEMSPGVSVSPSTWWYQGCCSVPKHNVQWTAKLRQFLSKVTPLETWRNMHWAGCVGEGVSTTLLLLLLVPTTNSEQRAHVRCSYQLLGGFRVDKSLFLTAIFHAWISSQSSEGVGPNGRSVAFSLLPVFWVFRV